MRSGPADSSVEPRRPRPRAATPVALLASGLLAVTGAVTGAAAGATAAGASTAHARASTAHARASTAHARASTAPVIQTIAGGGPGYLGWGSPAVGIGLDANDGVATDSSGNIYVASTYDNVVGQIAAPSTWTSRKVGYLAPFYDLWWDPETLSGPPSGASVVRTKNAQGQPAVHWTESNVVANTWIQADPSPDLIPGDSYTASVTVQGSGQVYLDFFNGGTDVDSSPVTLTAAPQTLTVTTTAVSGRAPQFQIRTPSAESSVNVLAYGGTIYGKAVTGATKVVAGTTKVGYTGDGGQGDKAEVAYPSGVAVSSSGDVYIADTGNNVVREVTPAGLISTVAGNGKAGYKGDGGLATNAELNSPQSVAVNSAGDLFIADTGNNVVREVSPAGKISTVAGDGTAGYKGNGGPATSAELCQPEGVAVSSANDLFVADTGNNVIREVKPGGTISTVAGDHKAGYKGDGGPATAAELDAPYGVTVDSAGDLYIADTASNRVREVAAGTISTIAGNGTQGTSGDGGAATSAELDNPLDVAIDSSTGDLYIVDLSGQVRQVTGLPTSS
jgi:trimeric autotransporter adhesin